MPRTYKPKPGAKVRKKYDEHVIQQAIEELTETGSPIEVVAKKFNISKSVLGRHKLRVMNHSGGQTALTAETEDYIVDNLNICSEWGFKLTTLDLRYVIKMFLDANKMKPKRFKDNFPGPDYIDGFLKRHKNKLSQRIKVDGRQLSSVPKGSFPRTVDYLLEMNATKRVTEESEADFQTCINDPLGENALSTTPEGTENEKKMIDESFIKYLKEMQYRPIDVKKPKSKRKLDIVSGESGVSHCGEKGESASEQKITNLETDELKETEQINFLSIAEQLCGSNESIEPIPGQLTS